MVEARIGDVVEFVDELGNEHNAIVTQVWGDPDNNPSINVVYVTDNENSTDQYGRQLERKTSVVPANLQPAHGMFYRVSESRVGV
jgi:hypothetical protein